MPEAVSESYANWAHRRDLVVATFYAFIGDDVAAKKARKYHVRLMHRGLDQAGVDMATEWAAPSSEPYKVVPRLVTACPHPSPEAKPRLLLT